MRPFKTFTVERSVHEDVLSDIVPSNIVSRQGFKMESEYEDEVMEGAEEEEEVWLRCARSMHSRSLKDFKGPRPGLPKPKKNTTVQAKEAVEEKRG